MSSQKKPILIASSTSDEHAYGPVVKILERRGYPVVIYRIDKVMTGKERLWLEVTRRGELTITYNGHSIKSDDLSAAWYRKLGNLGFQDADLHRAKQLFIQNEVKYLHDTIWPLYPKDIWLNSPDNMLQAERKLAQLVAARESGFAIPKTIISNNWGAISSRLLSDRQRQMIVKMNRGVISDNNNRIKVLYTTLLDEAKVDKIQNHTMPFPGLYQPFIQKAKEWRVTVVGNRVFALAIYTADTAKDDWRKHQASEAVRFVKEDLPKEVAEKCIQYLKKMGLRYGAFDFIEKADGEIVFLECNPNGQYGWLEEESGFPIAQAVAEELIRVSESRQG